MAGSTWNDSSDKDLLLAIIARGELKSINWFDIYDSMKSLGYTFSHEACRQHYQKIRRQRTAANGAEGSTQAAAPAKVPAKRKQPTKSKMPAIGKSTKAPKLAAAKSFDSGVPMGATNIDYDDDEVFDETPFKRIKSVKAESGVLEFPQFKMEEGRKETNEDTSFGSLRNVQVVDLEKDDLYEGDNA